MKNAKNLVLTSLILIAGVMVGVIAAPNISKLNISQLLGTTPAVTAAATSPTTTTDIASTNPADLNDLTPAAGEAEKTDATTDATETKTEEPSNFGPKDDGTLSADAAPQMTEVDLAAKAANTKTAAGFDLKAALADRVLGDENAPITFYDYSSLSCPHCKHFHNDFLPAIKKDFIDTGKVKLVFRSFPLNEAALQAEMLARCAPADQYYNMIQMFFDSQENWLSAENPKENFRQMVKIAGFNDQKFDTCLNNKELETGIIQIAQKGTETYGIDATPSFVIEDGVSDQELLKGLGLLDTLKQNLTQRYEIIQNAKETEKESSPSKAE